MNFYEQQDRARRYSARLVVLLALAVVGLIATATVAVNIIIAYLGTPQPEGYGYAPPALFDWRYTAGIAVAVISVVALGALFKHFQLRGGGKAVAESLNGRLIHAGTTDADERKVLNVVEEMAIAAGTPVPPVYILEDTAINAFAAGRTLNDAVIGLTRGCIRQLNRDELQGVIAHEFSHIIHGDMRLNTQLIATLHGILLIGLLGYFLLRSAPFRRSNRDNGALIMLAIGLVLVVVGFAGTFFGNIIKAAVSRQREFLADASAVQYTRNPDGIAGALKKIGSSQYGSELAAANAVEYSHMFFSTGAKSFLSSLMATHPPLPERIRRIEPQWDGSFNTPSPPAFAAAAPTAEPRSNTLGFPGQIAVMGAAVDAFARSSTADTDPIRRDAAEHAIDTMGQPDPSHIQYARRALAEIDPALREAAHDPYAARALVYGLLLARSGPVREQQQELLQQHALPDVYDALQRLSAQLANVAPRHRLLLVDIALPALKQMSEQQYRVFRRCLDGLVAADGQVSLMEWALRRIVTDHLEPATRLGPSVRLDQHVQACAVLLAAIAREGATDEAQARAAYDDAWRGLSATAPAMPDATAVNESALDQAVTTLKRLKPTDKPALLKALAMAAEHDGVISVGETEALRAIADALGCPLPPLV